MKRDWLIIPDFDRLSESLELSDRYGAAFEYNDFFQPEVYCDEKEAEKRIEVYKSLPRDRSKDTLHGAFLDLSIASKDAYIRKYSREKMEQSVKIAVELGVKGVIFHTGLIGGLEVETYIGNWLQEAESVIRCLLAKYPTIEIYMENTFEKSPVNLLKLKERLKDIDRFSLCLDYGHACLTETSEELWVEEMADAIGHIHLNDNDLKSDLHLVPGKGMIDMIHFENLLDTYDIKVPVLLEITGVDEQKQALKYMSAL